MAGQLGLPTAPLCAIFTRNFRLRLSRFKLSSGVVDTYIQKSVISAHIFSFEISNLKFPILPMILPSMILPVPILQLATFNLQPLPSQPFWLRLRCPKDTAPYLFLFFLVLVGCCSAQDWPQFLGPPANGVSDETGLLDKWPTNGLPLVWEKKIGA